MVKQKQIRPNKIAKVVYAVKDKTTTHFISEFSKLAQQEYKTRHYWVDIVIHWELRKNLKFYHMNKWNMHKPETVLE